MSGWPQRVTWVTRWREWRRERRQRAWVERELHAFNHRNDLARRGDKLCEKFGCHDDSSEWWRDFR